MGTPQLSQELKSKLSALSTSTLRRDEHPVSHPGTLSTKSERDQPQPGQQHTEKRTDTQQNLANEIKLSESSGTLKTRKHSDVVKSVTFSNQSTYYQTISRDDCDEHITEIQTESAIDVGNLYKNDGKLKEKKEDSNLLPAKGTEAETATIIGRESKFKSIWSKLTNFSNSPSSINERENGTNKKKEIKIISPPLQFCSNLPFSSNYCSYDNPSFIPSLQSCHSDIETNGTKLNDKSSLTSTITLSSAEDTLTKNSSSQTKINIHPTTSMVQQQNSPAEDDHPGSHEEPKQRKANGYITTSNVSTKAVVEVAKALRMQMQEQQKQKEQRNRYEMGNSSFRYISSDRINIIHSNAEAASDSIRSTGRENEFISLQINPSKIMQTSLNNFDSSDSSTSGYNSFGFSNSNQQQEENEGNEHEGIHRYFLPTNSSLRQQNLVHNKFSSFHGINKTTTFDDSTENESESTRFASFSDHVEMFEQLSSKGHKAISQYDSKRRTRDNFRMAKTSSDSHLNNIVYAELSFPRSKSNTFKLFEPKTRKNIINGPLRKDENRTSYSTLRFPPPSPRRQQQTMVASEF